MSATAQCMDALAKANRVRAANAAIAHDLATLPYPDARAELARIILDPPGHVGSMGAERLLMACRSVGPKKARRLLRLADAAPSVRVRALTVRQRKLLAGQLAAGRRLRTKEPA